MQRSYHDARGLIQDQKKARKTAGLKRDQWSPPTHRRGTCMIGSCVNSHADHGRSDIFTAPGFAREILEREVLRHEADETRLDDSLAKRLIVRLRRDDECHAKNQRQQQPPETPPGDRRSVR